MLAIIYSLSLSNIYTSTTLLAPTNKDDSLQSKLGQFSSLASFSGINIPKDSASKSDEAVVRIKSFEFFSKHFLPNVKLENIMAVSKWDANNNKIIYKSKIFDQTNLEWVREASYPKKIIPSEQEAFKSFNQSLYISIDKKSSFVTVSIQHQSPYIAKKWLDIIIYNINQSMRLEDITLSENYINFLNESQQSTNFKSLREVALTLLESQMQTLMLASANQAYVYKTIDPPIVAEYKTSPSRSLICILGAIIGGMLSVLIVLIRHYLFTEDK